LEHNLPIGTGRAPYGWEWGDKDKTFYVVNQEEAAVRFSIFHMFVELDMSLRSISHKLTEDGILPPAKSRGANVKSTTWNPSTVHMLLLDVANIGVLQICKSKKAMTPKGTETRKPNANMKTIPDGLPAIVPVELYERARIRLKTNQSDKSHVHRNPEDFLLKERIFCKTCNYRMVGRYQTSRKKHIYPYYACVNHRNKYDACPDLTIIRTLRVEALVWDDCCRVFERLDLTRDTIESNIQASLQDMLENTQGKLLVADLKADITYAKQERAKHPGGSYYYNLISQDVHEKEDRLRKYEAEYTESRDIVKLSEVYQKSILGFLNFLNTMKGKYHEATFKEKRNALDVLGVKVYIYPDTEEAPARQFVETDQEWLTVRDASQATGIHKNTLYYHIGAGELAAQRRTVPFTVIRREEVIKFLEATRRNVDLEQYPDEWFTVNKLVTTKLANYSTIHHAIRLGEVTTQIMDVTRPFVHRDELNRFLQASPL
jgi:hypothetical protein